MAYGSAATVTLSNVAVATVPSTWLETARPTLIVLPITIVSVPTTVHVEPFGDTDAVIVFPERTILPQWGGATPGPGVLVPPPRAVTRRWNAVPLVVPGVTIMKACAAPVV